MAFIRFATVVFNLGDETVLRLPEEASRKLPSRGIVLVEGYLNRIPFQAVLEPDGRRSHWFIVEPGLADAAGLSAGMEAETEMELSDNWPEPAVPTDLAEALKVSAAAMATWQATTPMARWDWIRWVRSTVNPETRDRRIAAACDKLGKGERRPCCFNRNLCTVPELSRKGILIDP